MCGFPTDPLPCLSGFNHVYQSFNCVPTLVGTVPVVWYIQCLTSFSYQPKKCFLWESKIFSTFWLVCETTGARQEKIADCAAINTIMPIVCIPIWMLHIECWFCILKHVTVICEKPKYGALSISVPLYWQSSYGYTLWKEIPCWLHFAWPTNIGGQINCNILSSAHRGFLDFQDMLRSVQFFVWQSHKKRTSISIWKFTF